MCIKGNFVCDKVVSSAYFSGISMLAATPCVSDLGRSFNCIKDMDSREKFQWLGSANSASLSMKEGMGIQVGGEVVTESEIHKKDCKDQIRCIKVMR
jgi:hypothetical protein